MAPVCLLNGLIDFLFLKMGQYLLSASLAVANLYPMTSGRSVVEVVQPIMYMFQRLLLEYRLKAWHFLRFSSFNSFAIP